MIDSMDENDLALRDLLLSGKATLAEGLQLYESMTAKGLDFPLA
jgi:hypothetical protein